MTSPVLMSNVIRARVANHLYVNKASYVDPNSVSPAVLKKARSHYSWKPDKAEGRRIKRLSKSYATY